MSTTDTWDRETYTHSISSRCWWFTPYDAGWEDSRKYGSALGGDEELRAIVAMELALEEIPGWAIQVVTGPLCNVAPCGHRTFPLSYLDVVRAIGTRTMPPVNHTCFTLDSANKRRLQDLILLLDAWHAGAAPQGAAVELQRRELEEWNWTVISADLWQALGEHTEVKDRLIERLLYQLRWWVKVTAWDDDNGREWGGDQYLGDFNPQQNLQHGNGNPLWPKGGVALQTSPRVQRLEAALAEACAHWPWFRWVINEASWPCGPKAFRYYEKLLWCIGRECPVISLPSFPVAHPEKVPNFLGPLAVEPDRAQASAWWQAYLTALDGWWQGQPAQGSIAEEVYHELGEATPLKHWLVRLTAHRLRMLERTSGILGRLVGR